MSVLRLNRSSFARIIAARIFRASLKAPPAPVANRPRLDSRPAPVCRPILLRLWHMLGRTYREMAVSLVALSVYPGGCSWSEPTAILQGFGADFFQCSITAAGLRRHGSSECRSIGLRA